MGAIGNLFNRLFGGKAKKTTEANKLSTLNVFNPTFSAEAKAEFNATFVSAVNAHARHLSKIAPKCYLNNEPAASRKYMDRIMGLNPNPVQNASQFWRAVAKSYYFNNVVIIYPVWDRTNYKEPLKELWPIDTTQHQVQVATTKSGRVAVKFTINQTTYYEFVEDLIILQRETDISNVFAGRSPAIDKAIKVIQTSYEGLEQAVRMSQYIRFIIQSSTNLSKEVIRQRQEEAAEQIFGTKDGVIYLSGADTLKEVQSNGKWPLAPELDSTKNDIYEYLGITSDIVKGKFTEDEWQAYQESSIEPFCIELGQELTRKLFTKSEIERGNVIRVDTDPLQTASLNTRIKIATAMMHLPVVVPNDIARLLYQPTFEGGEEPQASLNWVKGKDQSLYQVGQTEEEVQPNEQEEFGNTDV